MLLAVLSGFIVCLLAPWLTRSLGDRANWVLALAPAALFVYFLGWVPEIAQGEAITIHYPWIPGL
ncbi:hypothetical protein, partial [Aquisalimonas sp.]